MSVPTAVGPQAPNAPSHSSADQAPARRTSRLVLAMVVRLLVALALAVIAFVLLAAWRPDWVVAVIGG